NADLVLAMLKAPLSATPPAAGAPRDTRSWLALKANVGLARLVGVPQVTAEATNLHVSINRSSGSQTGLTTDPPPAPLNWATSLDLNNNGQFHESADLLIFDPATNSTGDEVTLDQHGDALKAEGTVKLGFAGFFYADTQIVFEKR